MILDLFLYFAKFPARTGVLSVFNNGSSSFAGYTELRKQIEDLPDALLPAIDSMVFGQSFDSVKTRVDSITGCFLFVDFGEISSRTDSRNHINDTQKLAVTIAIKKPSSADQVEEAIISATTLELITQLRAHLLADSESANTPFFERNTIMGCEIIPFVAPQLSSLGWTLMFQTSSSDLFDLKDRMSSFRRRLQ